MRRGPCETSRCLAAKLNSQLCLAAIFDSLLPSPKLSLSMSPKLSLAPKRGLVCLAENNPRDEGNSKGKRCLAAMFGSRHQDVSSGPLDCQHRGGPGSVRLWFVHRTVRKVPVFGLDGSSEKGSLSLCFYIVSREARIRVRCRFRKNYSDGSGASFR